MKRRRKAIDTELIPSTSNGARVGRRGRNEGRQ
jgi:hypothetical protein